MTREEFSEFLKSESGAAAVSLAAALRAAERRDRRALTDALYDFIQHKFLIHGTGCTDRDIIELSVTSNKRIIELSGGRKFEGSDVSTGCMGPTSTATKKILLLHVVEKEFDVSFTPQLRAEIEDVDQLVDELLSAREGQRAD